jgi:hypothetical protein
MLMASSGKEPAATRNGEGEPEDVRRATDGPIATSNEGLTTTVGERGPRDAPIISPPDVHDAEAPVVEISAEETAPLLKYCPIAIDSAQEGYHLALAKVVDAWSCASYPEMRPTLKGRAPI